MDGPEPTDPPKPTDTPEATPSPESSGPPQPTDRPSSSLTTNTSGPDPILEGFIIGSGTSFTSIANARKELEVMEPDATIDVTNPDGSVRGDGQPAATGTKVTITGAVGRKQAVTIVIPGDVLGTGKMGLLQLVRLAAASTNGNPLEGPYLLAVM